MAATYGSGSQSPPVIGRPLERVFEEAQHTGEVNLSGRKLKDYPKISSKFDLVDTIVSDLSKNRLGEVPHEVCEYRSMEKLNCYHNVIKVIPEAIMQLEALTHLNLSRNQLSVLPPTLCHLKTLEVLLASNNKLVSLPEEIGNLEKLMDLDVSCNEISHLPGQIGDLTSLRCLNVRRNLLVELPHEICKLNLRKLDFSSNRIEKIPTVFRKIESLEEMVLDHNPLSLPPAHICTRGRQHIMKFLQIEAIKEDRKRGILNEMDMKKLARKSLPPQQTSDDLRNMLLDSPESRWKRHTVLSADSGYSTTDSLEKCGWSPSEVTPTSDLDDANSLALKAAEVVKEQRQGRELDHHRRYIPDPYRKPTHDYADGLDLPPPPPNLSPRAEEVSSIPIQTTQPSPPAHLSSVALEDEFTRELTRQRAEYERRKKAAEQLRLQHEQEDEVKTDEKEERRRAAFKLQEEQRALMERQREERQREERQKEEARQLEAEEEARRQEEERQREEARLREEQKKEETKQEPRKTEGVRRMKGESSSYGYTANLHEEYYGRMYDHGGYDYSNQSFYISDYGYRKQPLGSSSSFKEDRKIHNNSTQYRRTTSDTATRRLQANQNTNTHVDNLNYINRNGVDENVNNSSSTTPIPSPSGSQHSIPSSPSTAPVSNIPSLSRVRESADRSSPHHSPVVRRAKATDRSGVSSPTPGRGTSRVGGTTAGSRLQGTTKKNHSTAEEEFKQKHQAMKNQHSQESNVARRRMEDSKLKTIQKDARGDTDDKKRSTTSRNTNIGSTTRGTRSGKCLNGQTDRHPKSKDGHSGSVLSQASMKLLEEYKDADPNFTIRRQHEQRLEELEQMDQLRATIESRLKVTLPDNLPDALKDGVVLCHLANQIRPRSVASIHVPSPAVPKLTMAKCRRNVENFLDACRKIGVDQEQICSAHDILEEKGISRVAITVAALVAIGTNPKQSAV